MESGKVLFIIGATAVGKTKLAIGLAGQYNAEIVSADSMQIYKGASLMTAKPTTEEMNLIPHHLVDLLDIQNKEFNVCKYQSLALKAIQEIRERGKAPIVVGGTMYYIESVLLRRPFVQKEPIVPELESEETSALYEKLQELDPEYAAQVSEHNRRRIRNALAYILATSSKYSQKDKTSTIRFPYSQIFWLKCEKEVLRSRVRNRIHSMLKEGGLNEIRSVLQNSADHDYTQGVLQSIGYKEFLPILIEGESALDKCIENLVISTMQYTNKQERWIKNRLIGKIPVHIIDTTHPENWAEILNNAIRLWETGEDCRNITEVCTSNMMSRICTVCNMRLIGESEWNQHIKSRKHKKNKLKEVI
jgi:tRNA dimethylallyltransferase